MLKPVNNPVTYFFGSSNDLAISQELGKLVSFPLFLLLEGPWIYSRNLKTHLIFLFLEIAGANQRCCALLEIS
jgi:hypothetical protein